MKETRKEYEEALKIYRELADQNPETYLSYVAKTLNNLGMLDRNQSQIAEAVRTYRELAQRDP